MLRRMKAITAKFNSTCQETGKPLKKGSTIYFDTVTRKAYHPDSQAVKNQREDPAAGYIDEVLEQNYSRQY